MVYTGKCSSCGRTYCSRRRGETVVCSCWKTCPICDMPMQPYKAEPAPRGYGLHGETRSLKTLMVCCNAAMHPDKAPFFSSLKPVEVVCL